MRRLQGQGRDGEEEAKEGESMVAIVELTLTILDLTLTHLTLDSYIVGTVWTLLWTKPSRQQGSDLEDLVSRIHYHMFTQP